MLLVLVVLAAFGLAAFTYLGVERLGRRAWIPLVCRGDCLGRAGTAAGQPELSGTRARRCGRSCCSMRRSAWAPPVVGGGGPGLGRPLG